MLRLKGLSAEEDVSKVHQRDIKDTAAAANQSDKKNAATANQSDLKVQRNHLVEHIEIESKLSHQQSPLEQNQSLQDGQKAENVKARRILGCQECILVVGSTGYSKYRFKN